MIKLLPEQLINQIKAGEVIDGPHSLVKELIENAIDAKSSEISITTHGSGLELIEVEDNGEGIDFDELPLAFTRHATSKIIAFNDLYNLSSFGFRGEALPSIAAVSKVIMLTGNKNSSSKIEINGSKIISHTKISTQKKGTSIFIQDLFFNTPVRLKFLKKNTFIKHKIIKTIKAIMLAHPEIKFSTKINDDDRKNFFSSSHEDRIKQIFNYQVRLTEKLDDYQITLYISKTPKNNYLFVNNRYLTDSTIHSILTKNISPFYGENFSYLLYITLPTDEVDVNIHPQKLQVRFFTPERIYALIMSLIKKIIPTNIDTHKTSKHLANFVLLDKFLIDKRKLWCFELLNALKGPPSPIPLTIYTSYTDLKNIDKLTSLGLDFMIQDDTYILTAIPRSISHIFIYDLIPLLDRLDTIKISLKDLVLLASGINIPDYLFYDLLNKKKSYFIKNHLVIELTEKNIAKILDNDNLL